MFPAPIQRTWSGRPLIGTPPDDQVAQATRDIEHAECHNKEGCGSFSFVSPRPLTTPTSAPTRNGVAISTGQE